MTTPLRRGQGELLHRQLFLALREQIKRGVYAEGAVIPPEDQLCELFGVSRITVRRAVADLVSAGWVERRQGLGTFVTHSSITMPQASVTLAESLMKRSKETQVAVLDVSLRVPPLDIAKVLDVPAQSRAVCASRVRSAEGVPLIAMDTWIVEKHAAPVTAEALKGHTIPDLLASVGVKLGRVSEEISAVAADPHVARLLEVEVGSPLLRIFRVVHDHRHKPIVQQTSHLAPERSRLVFELENASAKSVYEARLIHDVVPRRAAKARAR